MFSNNSDVDTNIVSFLNIHDLAKTMSLNKTYNIISMQLISNSSQLRSQEHTGIMHMGLLIGTEQKAAKKYLLRGLKYTEAVLSSKCMICEKVIVNRGTVRICPYGFPTHDICMKKRETRVTRYWDQTRGIDYEIHIEREMIPYMKNLRTRMSEDNIFYAIRSGYHGVYPEELSMTGYLKTHKVEIAYAKMKASISNFEKLIV